MSAVVDACKNAEIFIPAVIASKSGYSLITYYGSQAAEGTGAREMYGVLRALQSQPQRLKAAMAQTLMLPRTVSNSAAQIMAVSPITGGWAAAVARINKLFALSPAERPTSLPQFKPNDEAMALNVEFSDGGSVLLGSDLEEHAGTGWSSVAGNFPSCGLIASNLVKIPHHGGESAHHQSMWDVMVSPAPIGMVTPFQNGSLTLPTEGDYKRLRSSCSLVIVTSHRNNTRVTSDTKLIEKRLERANIKRSRRINGFGAVRTRRMSGTLEWTVEKLGLAHEI
jgi:hypothetical protein